MSMAGVSEQGTHISAPPMHCPSYPQAVTSAQHQDLTVGSAALFYAEGSSHPSMRMQVEAWARVALDGAWHKRGPPSPSSVAI